MRVLAIALICLVIGCRNKHTADATVALPLESPNREKPVPPKASRDDYDTSRWIELTEAQGFALELRYADESNFTGKQIYDCGRCFLQRDAGEKLIRLQRDIAKRYGWRLRLYDCYRPRPAQQRLWDIMPNASYVTPPHKGSMHNRGLAIDVTIDDKDGRPMDMGSDFDHFGKEAHIDIYDHTDEVLRNRRILQKLMELHGFKGIRTEWWHYSLRGVSSELSAWEWGC